MRRRTAVLAPAFTFGLLAIGGCSTERAPVAPDVDGALLARNATPGVHRQYGPPITLGEGKVRTYVVRDEKTGAPLEIGVAIDRRALEGELPATGSNNVLQLPPLAPAPFDFVLFDWNPGGHEPPGVYDLPHFDFHFYMTPWSEVAQIVPTNPDFAAQGNNIPTGAYVPQFYALPVPPGVPPVAVAVPMMGLHWSDMRSPELQAILGNPAGWAPFTKTFIYGSWNGRFTFVEPMVTLEYLLQRTDETIPVPVPAMVPEPGWYPHAYRIGYDAHAREYRVAITGLVEHP